MTILISKWVSRTVWHS